MARRGEAAVTSCFVLATKAQIKAKLETFFGRLDGWEEEKDWEETTMTGESNFSRMLCSSAGGGTQAFKGSSS